MVQTKTHKKQHIFVVLCIYVILLHEYIYESNGKMDCEHTHFQSDLGCIGNPSQKMGDMNVSLGMHMFCLWSISTNNWLRNPHEKQSVCNKK
jgi:hypothetical protein